MAPYPVTGSSGTTVWLEWTANTATTNGTYDPFPQWTAQTTVSYYPGNAVWANWHSLTNVRGQDVHVGARLPQISAEQQAASAAKAKEMKEKQAQARARAKALLEGVLNKRQRQEFKQNGYFHVHTKNGKRRYRLSPGHQPMRVQGEDGKRWYYCIHPDHGYPPEDTVVALKLLLETDEEEFLSIANASPAR